jgi:hypothetical protein
MKFAQFANGKEVPDLTADYHAIGFDTCLVNYTPEMKRLVIKSFLQDLVDNFDYPA